jgi:hypothetical protein
MNTDISDPVCKQILGIETVDPVGDWYVLLGVDKFESDEVILDQAMLKRFESVRRYQVGKYEEQALRLLDELGRAYACLTNVEERREYDKTLSASSTHDTIATNELSASTEAASVAPVPVAPSQNERTANTSNSVAADSATCPQCRKPSSPKARVCYQCGYRKPVEAKSQIKPSGQSVVHGERSLRELVRQDLTPQQLLARLQEARKLTSATKLASGVWKAPTQQKAHSKSWSNGRSEASSRCHRCRKGLMHASNAFGIQQAEVRGTLEFVRLYAKKLESLGREQFDWPLSDTDVQRLLKMISAIGSNGIALFCYGCAVKILRSPKLSSGNGVANASSNERSR